MADAPSHDPTEDPVSARLSDVLRQRRNELSATSRLPTDDAALSERILAEARRRSAELSARQTAPGWSNRRQTAPQRIPWWLIAAWAAAIAGVIAAFLFLT